MKPTVLVSGASSAVGKCCAGHLSDSGYDVHTLARADLEAKAQRMPVQDWTQDEDSKLDQERIAEFVLEEIWNKKGPVDTLVNCLDYGLIGPIEETTPQEAQTLFQANVIDMITICRSVLPLMRQQRSGLIVNVGLEADALPSAAYHGVYSASRSAIEDLSSALSEEAGSFGVDVALVRTSRAATASQAPVARHAQENSAYKDFERHRSEMKNNADESPHSTALLIERLIQRACSDEDRVSGGPRTCRLFKQVAETPTAPPQFEDRSPDGPSNPLSSPPTLITFAGTWDEHDRQEVEDAIMSFELYRMQNEETEPKGWTCTGRSMHGENAVYVAHRHEGGTCFSAGTSRELAALILDRRRDYHPGTLHRQREYVQG